MGAITDVSGVILAGGLSTRIGLDKGEVEIGGRRQWVRAADKMRLLFSEVVYVTNDHDFVSPYPDMIVAHDEVPHLGPLGGIMAGLKAAANDRVFVVAYDMPFVVPELVRFLCGLDPEADVIVPVIAGEYEPLHAVYDRSCLSRIRSQLKSGRRKIVDFYKDVNLRAVDESELREVEPGLRTFFNINTWDDVHQADSLLQGEDT